MTLKQPAVKNNKLPNQYYNNPEFQQDIRVLLLFIGKNCTAKHKSEKKHVATLKKSYQSTIKDISIPLCPACQRLFDYAVTRRYYCKRNPNPMCKECLKQCYHPVFKDRILKIITFSNNLYDENVYMP